MKTKISVLLIAVAGIVIFFAFKPSSSADKITAKDCVFNTVFGVVELDSSFRYAPTDAVISSVEEGLAWLEKAQHPDGGWGAGFHNKQHQMDPHAVPADPATTAMVSMALLRTGSSLVQGQFQVPLEKATEYLLKAVESAIPNGSKITELNGTQIQRKLGDNIDLVLTTQYLTNLLDEVDDASALYQRIFNAVNKSVDMVQTAQDENGKTKGAGWAGVLQSAFATNALEAAEAKGAMVDNVKLNKSKAYQRSNYDPASSKVETKDGAGITLYAVSGSARTNAKEARKAKEILKKAKTEGLLAEEEVVSFDNLVKAGMDENDALTYDAAYQVYESAKVTAQDKKVTSGFGNNGGEEFMSFLQTGESLIINKDDSWKKWYDSVSANLLNIQNQDGSWNGHHCITSPVFCTATCLLILSVNNDIEQLVAQGE